jgi:hypothetical protein
MGTWPPPRPRSDPRNAAEPSRFAPCRTGRDLLGWHAPRGRAGLERARRLPCHAGLCVITSCLRRPLSPPPTFRLRFRAASVGAADRRTPSGSGRRRPFRTRRSHAPGPRALLHRAPGLGQATAGALAVVPPPDERDGRQDRRFRRLRARTLTRGGEPHRANGPEFCQLSPRTRSNKPPAAASSPKMPSIRVTVTS